MNVMKTTRTYARLLLVLALLAPGLAVAADFVVIVNPANKASALTRTEVQRYFLKNATVWPSGETVRPVDLQKTSPVRMSFTSEILGRSLPAIDQFWTQSIYSGRAVPPPERRSDREVVEFVRENPGAIGYVSPGAALDGVKKIAVSD
jgi:ABC-type phosphate transport system substrate-binding protein